MRDREKRRRKSGVSDWQTYKRLLRYLHGMKWVIILLFTCMILEAAFTVLTISSIKPIMELMLNDRVVDTSRLQTGPRLDVEQEIFAGSGMAAVKAVGPVGGARGAEKLRDRLTALTAPPNSGVVLDLSQATDPDAGTWGALAMGRLLADERGVSVTVVMPPATRPPAMIADSAAFRVVDTSSPLAAELRGAFLDSIVISQKAGKPDGAFAKLKKSLIERFRPSLERLQHYTTRSTENKFRVLAVIILAMLFGALMTTLCGFGVGFLSAFLAAKVVNRLRNHVYAHTMRLDMHYFNSHSAGSIMSSITQDVGMVSGAIDILFGSVLKTPITVGMLVGAMMTVSVKLTLFCFLVVPVISLMLYILGRRVRRVSRRIQEIRAEMSGILQETIAGARVVKAYTMEEHEISRFRKLNAGAFGKMMRTAGAEELGTSLTQFLASFTVAMVVLGGGWFILRPPHALSGSDFALFIGFLMQAFRPLKNVSRTTSKIQKGLAGCDRVFGVLDTSATVIDRPGATPAAPLRDALVFDGVGFSYGPARPPVLHDINLRVPAGKAVAIVGETGSGKSTLVNLLPRFYDPTAGRLTWDGTDLRDLQLLSLRDNIALITQDVVVFDATIAENISYGRHRAATREEIVAAAKAANAHRFIEKLPKGYDTMVGARGTRLSGGERQRIAIARAILKDAPVMILDEATSSLDSETEALIQEALARVMKGRTVFVIAHRLSTIQNCDEIYVLDAGRFVEQGTHDKLLARNGQYARYHAIQFGKKDEPADELPAAAE